MNEGFSSFLDGFSLIVRLSIPSAIGDAGNEGMGEDSNCVSVIKCVDYEERTDTSSKL